MVKKSGYFFKSIFTLCYIRVYKIKKGWTFEWYDSVYYSENSRNKIFKTKKEAINDAKKFFGGMVKNNHDVF